MKYTKALALLCIIIIFFSLPTTVFAENKENKHIILIDPGHGGIDGGAKTKNGTIEKDINLDISLKLRDHLIEKGYEVYMTREDDKELDTKKVNDLTQRCKLKKETNCDIFISIHQNMFQQSSCFGAQVWYSDNENSRLLAESIQESMKSIIQDNNKRISKAAKNQYKILRDNYEGASIIVECGFLSNKEEEQKLKDANHQGKIVEGIVLGIEKYFEDKN